MTDQPKEERQCELYGHRLVNPLERAEDGLRLAEGPHVDLPVIILIILMKQAQRRAAHDLSLALAREVALLEVVMKLRSASA